MSLQDFKGQARPARRGSGRKLLLFPLVLLTVEFLDELVDGVRGAAWPLMRDDLRLSYEQVGVLLSVPALFGHTVEPLVGILADVWNRRALVLAGGVFFALAALLVANSYSFAVLLVAFAVFSPAAGAFVGLSQAALMDADPARREQNMARWTLAGSLGNTAGPLAVASVVALGAGWRALFAALSLFAVVALVAASRFRFPAPARAEAGPGVAVLKEGARGALRGLRRREVLRWLVLLEFGDLTADILRGFLALYFVDVVGASEAQAALALIVWQLVGLPGDFFLIPLLERVRGLSYLRWSTAATLVLFPLFLLAESLALKLVLLGLLGFANAGWYSILKAQLYGAMPGRSGTVMTLGNLSGLVWSLVPLALGGFAGRYGLEAMMWLLLAGPVVLLAGLLSAPRGGE